MTIQNKIDRQMKLDEAVSREFKRMKRQFKTLDFNDKELYKFYQEVFDIAHDEGYTKGWDDGGEEGFIKGEKKGFDNGYEEGQREGYYAGEERGYEDGYDAGQREGDVLGDKTKEREVLKKKRDITKWSRR